MACFFSHHTYCNQCSVEMMVLARLVTQPKQTQLKAFSYALHICDMSRCVCGLFGWWVVPCNLCCHIQVGALQHTYLEQPSPCAALRHHRSHAQDKACRRLCEGPQTCVVLATSFLVGEQLYVAGLAAGNPCVYCLRLATQEKRRNCWRKLSCAVNELVFEKGLCFEERSYCWEREWHQKLEQDRLQA